MSVGRRVDVVVVVDVERECWCGVMMYTGASVLRKNLEKEMID